MSGRQVHPPGTSEVFLGRQGALLLATALCMLLTGVYTGLYVVCAWGVLLVAAVSVAYASTAIAMSGEPGGYLDIHLKSPVLPERTLRSGARLRFGFEMSNPTARQWEVCELRLVHSMRMERHASQESLSLPSELSLQVKSAGVHTVFGVQVCGEDVNGLTGWFLYVPHRWSARALPRSSRGARSRLQPRSPIYAAHTLPPLGAALAGTSLDLKELRLRVAGDSFRHIAWKASARHGKLMVREYETDVGMSVYLIVDVGPSMRVGSVGQTPLDQAMEVAYALAEDLSKRRSRLGVVLCDRGILAFEKAVAARTETVAATLFEAYAVADFTRTEDLDSEIIERVAEYAWSQYGRWFYVGVSPTVGVPEELQPGARGVLEELSLHAWIQDRLALVADPSRGRLAASDRMHNLRLFCLTEGLELAYRGYSRSDEKEEDLCEALKAVSGSPGGPHGVVLFSDLEGIDSDGPLSREILRLRRQRYDVTVLHPSHGLCQGIPVEWEDLLSRAPDDPGESIYRTLVRLYGNERDRRQRRWRAAMSVGGVPVLSIQSRRQG
jgi:uncharacterized protein (DUF58 family)